MEAAQSRRDFIWALFISSDANTEEGHWTGLQMAKSQGRLNQEERQSGLWEEEVEGGEDMLGRGGCPRGDPLQSVFEPIMKERLAPSGRELVGG